MLIYVKIMKKILKKLKKHKHINRQNKEKVIFWQKIWETIALFLLDYRTLLMVHCLPFFRYFHVTWTWKLIFQEV